MHTLSHVVSARKGHWHLGSVQVALVPWRQGIQEGIPEEKCRAGNGLRVCAEESTHSVTQRDNTREAGVRP